MFYTQELGISIRNLRKVYSSSIGSYDSFYFRLKFLALKDEVVVVVLVFVKIGSDIVALEGLSLDVFENEVFALLGPNSAGKSTTINILTGKNI